MASEMQNQMKETRLLANIMCFFPLKYNQKRFDGIVAALKSFKIILIRHSLCEHKPKMAEMEQ